MAEEQELRKADYGMAAFLVAALVGGNFLDFARVSWRYGLVSLVITIIGIWLLFKALRKPIPTSQKALYALGIMVLTLVLRMVMFKVLGKYLV
ncbi:hypothetical protein [Hymenobacter koreensis]|uniref:Uncharacterized protein n=1 Tax=Hymenobacter koreensis TaxID=1084523 RepID=A0ABP8IW70_9BACT